jgi:CBS domain-containing protein
MNARDVMTAEVISVTPDTSVQAIAKLLIDHAISAVPVVDEQGNPLGMVSEGDLIGRDETAREARRDWWLTLLAEGETLNADFLASARGSERKARDVMSAPLVTIGETADIGEIAALLATHRMKRVPVLSAGRIVGIVSRADLLRAMASERRKPAAPAGDGFLSGAIAKMDDFFLHHAAPEDGEKPATPQDPSAEPVPNVTDFQHLLSGFDDQERERREAARQAIPEQRRHRAAELTDKHVSDASWQGLLHQAREAAAAGQKDMTLLSFPSELCSDGGRAINVTEEDWPATLRGEAAELYLRWERELKPQGFHLTATVLDFPGGKPGDIGLMLRWGE